MVLRENPTAASKLFLHFCSKVRNSINSSIIASSLKASKILQIHMQAILFDFLNQNQEEYDMLKETNFLLTLLI